jgi:hypothetical protein
MLCAPTGFTSTACTAHLRYTLRWVGTSWDDADIFIVLAFKATGFKGKTASNHCFHEQRSSDNEGVPNERDWVRWSGNCRASESRWSLCW